MSQDTSFCSSDSALVQRWPATFASWLLRQTSWKARKICKDTHAHIASEMMSWTVHTFQVRWIVKNFAVGRAQGMTNRHRTNMVIGTGKKGAARLPWLVPSLGVLFSLYQYNSMQK